MQDIGKLEDEWTMARFAARYESEVPEDWPRCEDCSEPLGDEENGHSGDNLLCDRTERHCTKMYTTSANIVRGGTPMISHRFTVHQ